MSLLSSPATSNSHCCGLNKHAQSSRTAAPTTSSEPTTASMWRVKHVRVTPLHQHGTKHFLLHTPSEMHSGAKCHQQHEVVVPCICSYK